MTRKDYIKAAAIIRDMTAAETLAYCRDHQATPDYILGVEDARHMAARRMAAWFAADNPNFDRQRFLTACGLED